MKKRVRRLVLVAAIAIGFGIAAQAPAHADGLCARLTVWQPIGEQSLCAPMP